MKKGKIANKLFFLISISLALLLGLQMIFQSLYLDQYYLRTKKERIAKKLVKISKEISEIPLEEINKQLLKFSEEIGGATGIIDLYGATLYGFNTQRSFIEVKTKEDEVYKVYFEGILAQGEEIPYLKEGAEVKITGTERDNENVKELYPSEIEIKVGEESYTVRALESVVRSSQIALTMEAQQSLNNINGDEEKKEPASLIYEAIEVPTPTIIEGVIGTIYIPGESTYGNAYRENTLIQETNQFIYEQIINNQSLIAYQPIIYEKLDTYIGVNNIIGVIPTFLKDMPVLLTSMVSLQGIKESTEIMNQYVLISFVIILIIALIGAYWYSKKLTKPLVELRNVTTAIAQLDFNKYCEVRSEDEIGELAYNINQMSHKLEESLNALKKDIELKEYLEVQRKQLIADVSHELKTPLTVMKGICYGVIDGIYSSEDTKNFEALLGQINQMSDLVHELLEVSRLEADVALEQEVFVLSDLVFKVHKSFKTLIGEKKLQVILNLQEHFVLGDRKKIERVIRNLYNNAIFYTPCGESIELSIEKIKSRVCFKIMNQGVSIPSDLQEKIWNPFYCIDQSRNKKLGGSGLGLYMVKCILEKHYSHYGMRSDSNSVTFWFDLEAVEEEEWFS